MKKKISDKALPSSSSSLLPSLLLLISSLIAMAASSATADSSPAVHIVYTEKPEEVQDFESFHLKTLSSALGSEEAAKDSLVYVYTAAAFGFSARLTPEQVEILSKQPGVLQVVPSQILQLHKPGGLKNHLL